MLERVERGQCLVQERQIDCTANPIWTQVVAGSYGLVYANCNIDASFETSAIDLTTVDATVADVVRSVAAFQAGDTFNGNDLVTIWVGMHDILDDYRSNATSDESGLLADMRAQGQTLAGVVNAIAAAGGKVVLLTVPDMSESPFAYAESLRGDFDRLKLLSDMSTAFNLGLRTHIINDGSQVALVTVDDLVRNATRASGSAFIQFDNQSYGCLDTAPLPACTIDTLRNDPTTGQPTQSFLWADAMHLGASMQAQIGGAASQRAHGNPF